MCRNGVGTGVDLKIEGGRLGWSLKFVACTPLLPTNDREADVGAIQTEMGGSRMHQHLTLYRIDLNVVGLYPNLTIE
jgi:hypothetical protein